jgi:hypothetical protein
MPRVKKQCFIHFEPKLVLFFPRPPLAMWWLRARVPQGRPESRLIRVRLLEFRCRRGDDAKMRFPSGTDSLFYSSPRVAYFRVVRFYGAAGNAPQGEVHASSPKTLVVHFSSAAAPF